jgi:hypothetical protein
MNPRKIFCPAFASVCLTLALIGIFGVVYLIAQQAGNKTYVTAEQPITAISVARQIDCGRVQDRGPAPQGGVFDVATCWKDGHEYAIDTFVSENARNNWLKISENLGVVPMWEAATWVAYPSIDPTPSNL